MVVGRSGRPGGTRTHLPEAGKGSGPAFFVATAEEAQVRPGGTEGTVRQWRREDELSGQKGSPGHSSSRGDEEKGPAFRRFRAGMA